MAKPVDIAAVRAARSAAKKIEGGSQGGELRVLPIVLDPRNPWAIANSFLTHECRHLGNLTLRYWHGGWWGWLPDGGWCPLPEQTLRDRLWPWLSSAQQRDRHGELVPLKPNARLVDGVKDALRSAAPLPPEVQPPAWLPSASEDEAQADAKLAPARSFIAVANGRLDIGADVLLPPSPRYFVTSASPVAWRPDAPLPIRWLQLLEDEIWPGDAASVACFQQWCGYLLSGRNDLHKVLFVVGPKRSGKGTLSKVMSWLVGERNTVRPLISSVARPFGLEQMIGKSLVVVPDARLGSRVDQAQIVELVLSLSGGDNPAIDRKFKEAWTGSLSARLVIMSNELPDLADASGAFASRLLVLRMVHSFYGVEDVGLASDLEAELPGILVWALNGLRDLMKERRFIAPGTSAETMQALRKTGSEVQAFVDDYCLTGPDERCRTDALYEAFVEWRKGDGRDGRVSREAFGRRLRAVCPEVERVQMREGKRLPWSYKGISIAPAPEPTAQAEISLS